MRIITVQELTRYIKTLIEKEYLLANIWVKGEISNFKAHSSGHLYFTLKDNYSSIKVVMFRSKQVAALSAPKWKRRDCKRVCFCL